MHVYDTQHAVFSAIQCLQTRAWEVRSPPEKVWELPFFLEEEHLVVFVVVMKKARRSWQRLLCKLLRTR